MLHPMKVHKPAHDSPGKSSPRARQLRHLSTLNDILGRSDREEFAVGAGDAEALLQSMLGKGIASSPTLSQGLRDKDLSLAKLKSRAHAAESREAAAKVKVTELSQQVSLLSAHLELAKKEKWEMEQLVEEQRKQLRGLTVARRKKEKVIQLAKKDQERMEQTLKDLSAQVEANEVKVWDVKEIGVQAELESRADENDELEKMNAVVLQQQKEIEHYEGFAEQAKHECMLLATKVVEIVRKNDALTKSLENERETLKTVAERFCQEQRAAREAERKLEETDAAFQALTQRFNIMQNQSPKTVVEAQSHNSVKSIAVAPREEITRRNMHHTAAVLVQAYCASGINTAVQGELNKVKERRVIRERLMEFVKSSIDVIGENVNSKMSSMISKLHRLESALQRTRSQQEQSLTQFEIEKANLQSMIKCLHIREAESEARESQQNEKVMSLSGKLSALQESSVRREEQLEDAVRRLETELADFKNTRHAHISSVQAEIGQEIAQWQKRASNLQTTIRQLSSNLGKITNKQQEALETVEEEKQRLKLEMVGVLECMEFMFEDSQGKLVNTYLNGVSRMKDLVQLHASIASLKVLSRKAELVHLQKELELSQQNEKQLKERSNILSSSLSVCERHLLTLDPESVEVQRSLRSSRLRLVARRIKEINKHQQELKSNSAGSRERLQVLIEEAEQAVQSHHSQRKKRPKLRRKNQDAI